MIFDLDKSANPKFSYAPLGLNTRIGFRMYDRSRINYTMFGSDTFTHTDRQTDNIYRCIGTKDQEPDKTIPRLTRPTKHSH